MVIPRTRCCENSSYDHTTKPCTIKSKFFSVPVFTLSSCQKCSCPHKTYINSQFCLNGYETLHSPKPVVISSFWTLLTGVLEYFSHFYGHMDFSEALESTKSVWSPYSLEVLGLHSKHCICHCVPPKPRLPQACEALQSKSGFVHKEINKQIHGRGWSGKVQAGMKLWVLAVNYLCDFHHLHEDALDNSDYGWPLSSRSFLIKVQAFHSEVWPPSSMGSTGVSSLSILRETPSYLTLG